MSYKKRSWLYFFILFALHFFIPVSFAASLDLDSFLRKVKNDSPVLRSARYHQRSAADRVKPTGSLDDPFVAVGLDQLPFSGENMSVIRYQINQTVPFPGKLKTRMQVAKGLSEINAADTETLTRQIVIMATYLFYKGYYLQESLKNNAAQMLFVRTIAQSEESRYKAGESQHHEWLLAMAESGILQTESLRLKREKAVLDATLNQYLNNPIDTPIGTLVVRFGSDLMNQGSENDDLKKQPEYKAYQAQLKAAISQRKLAKFSWAPDFMVQTMVMQSRHEDEEPSNWGAMVGLNIPIFGYRKQAKLVSAMTNDVKAAEADLELITNKLETARKSVQLDVETAKSVVRLYRSAIIPQTELAFQSARSIYESQKLPLSSLLQIARVRQTQKLEFLAAQLDVELAKVKGRELLSEPPFLRLAPTIPTLFGAGGMGQVMTDDMGTSAAGMGTNGMTGPTAKPQKMGDQNEDGMSGGGM